MSNTFVINGKTYRSLEEMPPDVRAQWDAMQAMFTDKDQNGMPDMMDDMAESGATMMQSSTIVYQGKAYARPDDLPPEGRAAYEAGMGKLTDANHDGTPDVMQDASYAAPVVVTTQISSNMTRTTVPPPTTSNLGPVIVIVIVIGGLILATAILLFLVLNKTR